VYSRADNDLSVEFWRIRIAEKAQVVITEQQNLTSIKINRLWKRSLFSLEGQKLIFGYVKA
jgi:hypothetical protein